MARMTPSPLLARLALRAPVRGVLRGRPVVRAGRRLDPDVQWLLRLESLLRPPSLTGESVEEARRNFRRTASLLAPSGYGQVRAREASFAGPGGEVPARVYTPPGAASPGPALLFFHGGGWVLGDLDTHDGVCRRFAAQAGCRVVAVHYRRAPVHRCPAAAEDAFAALRWLVAEGAALGVDPARIAVGGDSAGGNLSAVVAQRARDEGLGAPCFQLLIYPGLDMSREAPSYDTFGEGFLLSREDITWFKDHYQPDRARRADPVVSPLRAEDVAGVAPACVLTAGFDPLVDEGRAYAAKLKAAGVEVEDTMFEGLVHGFLNLAGAIPAADRAFDHAAGALRAAFARVLTTNR